LLEKQVDAVLDDRPGRVGLKLKDADLIGFPIKVIVGPKGLKEGKVEVKMRSGGEVIMVEVGRVVEEIVGMVGK
jgi:prolyl-tRNA synthetase